MPFHPNLLSLIVLYALQSIRLVWGHTQHPVFHPQNTSVSPLLDEEFDTWLQETGKEWGMKGLAIAIVQKDGHDGRWLTETKGYGIADRWGHPVNEETLFSIGSNSKLFTALGVGLLVANKSLSVEWNTKIKDLLPPNLWGLDDRIAQDHANIVDLLSHQTGLPSHQGSYSRGGSVESLLAKQRYLRPSAEFRDTFQYNNQMYTVASHIVSRLARTPFTEYIMRNIISPLGMASTTYDVSYAERSGKLADGFINAGRDEQRGEGASHAWFRPIPYWNHEDGRDMVAGPGGVISTAKDMATWLRALLQPDDRIIPASVITRVSRGVSVSGPTASFPELSPILYGMGQMRYAYQGHELIEHNGGTPGQYSVVTRLPQDGLGVAILTNWDAGTVFQEVVKWKLLEKALKLNEVPWNDRYHALMDETHVTPQPTGTPPPPHTGPPTVPIVDVSGIYFNPAYGTLYFCAFPPPTYLHPLQRECHSLIADARTALRSFLNDSVPTLLAASPGIVATHVALRHAAGDRYTAFALNAYPAPFPEAGDADAHPFAVAGPSWSATLVLRRDAASGFVQAIEGMAWTGGVWGSGAGVRPPKGEGREGAEVWFDRV